MVVITTTQADRNDLVGNRRDRFQEYRQTGETLPGVSALTACSRLLV